MIVSPSGSCQCLAKLPNSASDWKSSFSSDERERADHGAAPAADAAEDDHQQHGARLMPREDLGIHEAVLDGVEEPASPRARRRARTPRACTDTSRSRRAHALLVRRMPASAWPKRERASTTSKHVHRRAGQRHEVERQRPVEIEQRDPGDRQDGLTYR
jgi:hypothetical protein